MLDISSYLVLRIINVLCDRPLCTCNEVNFEKIKCVCLTVYMLTKSLEYVVAHVINIPIGDICDTPEVL